MNATVNFSFLFQGYVNDNLNFEYGENTDAYAGCSAMLNGQMYYFGGGGRQGDSKQVQIWSFT